jgi:hypothetical protein
MRSFILSLYYRIINLDFHVQLLKENFIHKALVTCVYVFNDKRHNFVAAVGAVAVAVGAVTAATVTIATQTVVAVACVCHEANFGADYNIKI